MSVTVSLALPVYDGEKYLSEAVRSLLAQDFEDFELIITDNASTDRTGDISRMFAERDTRVSYIRNERNMGAAANFNIGFHASTGRYFKWCAYDDLISPNYVGDCVRALEAQPDAVLAFGSAKMIDGDGRVVGDRNNAMAGIIDEDGFERFRNIFDNSAHCDEIFGLHRREVLQRTSLMGAYWSADRTLLEEIAMMGKFAFVPGAVFYNRHHPERSILIGSKTGRSQWQSGHGNKRFAVEYLARTTHLLRIAFRHRRAAPLRKTLPLILKWACKPMRLSQYSVELIGFVSPSFSAWLRGVGWRMLNKGKQNSAS